MDVVILAGGMGTRIRSVAGECPKSLIPVAGKPFIEHQFDLLKKNGLSRVTIMVGYLGEMIRDHVGDGSGFGLEVSCIMEEPGTLMGTGGALIQGLSDLPREFLLMYGDSYLPVDYRAIIAGYRAQSRPALMSVYRNKGQWDSSNVRIQGGRVIFYSKQAAPGEADYIDYGLSIFSRDVLEGYRDARMPLDLAVILEDLVGRDALAAYEVARRFYEIGKPEGLRELEAMLSGKS